MAKAKLPVIFANGDYSIKNKEIELEITGPSKEVGKEVGVIISNYIMETFDRVLETFTLKGPAGKVANFTEVAEAMGNIMLAAEVINDTAFLIMEIVDAVRAANTTTFILINAVPGTTLRLGEIDLSDGEWVGVSEATMKQEKATNKPGSKKASALIFNTQPYRSGGLQRGELEIKLQLPYGHDESMRFYWDNPLGVDRKRKKAHYTLNDKKTKYQSGTVQGVVNHKHSDKPGKKRHDIVTVMLLPSKEYFIKAMQ